MFVVSPATRVQGPQDVTFTIQFPVVFEDAEHGFASTPVAHRGSREDAQKVADGLNAVLVADVQEGSQQTDRED